VKMKQIKGGQMPPKRNSSIFNYIIRYVYIIPINKDG
jgi:hypothetical protein